MCSFFASEYLTMEILSIKPTYVEHHSNITSPASHVRYTFIIRVIWHCKSEIFMEGEGTERVIEKIGINVRRHKELISRLSELLEASGSGAYISASQLIDLIANEPTFTKKECVYLGLYLASTNLAKEQS